MAGKYAHIIARLPRLLGTEPAYQEKVEAVKAAMKEEQKICTGCGLTFTAARETGGDCPGATVTPPYAHNWVQSVMHATKLADTYISIRHEIDSIEAQLSEANLRLEATSQIMIDQYETEDIVSLKFDGVGSVSLQYEPYAKVEDKEAFRLWCLNNGLAQSLMLPWQTTNAITKERLLAGDPEPVGVKAHAKTKIVLRKA